MALVAYASSDSECSDEDDDNKAAISTQSVRVVNKTVPVHERIVDSASKPATSTDLTGDPHISDDEEIYPLSTRSGGQGLTLPTPKHPAPPENESLTVHDEDEGGPCLGLLAGLPQPKSAGTRAGGKEEAMEEDELEDIVKPKKGELALQEKPPGKKTRQPVKILIPALQGGEEGKDEDREPSRKKMRPTPGKSGLLAFLPPPKQTITKETNRSLIPHTLSKRPAPARKPAQTLPQRQPASKMTPLLPGIEAADDSDDDDDNDNPTPSFFTFSDSDKETTPVKLRPTVDIVQPVGAAVGPALRPQGPTLRPQGPAQQVNETESETSQADAPLQFRDHANAPLQFSQTQPQYHAAHVVPTTASSWSQSEGHITQNDYSVNRNEVMEYPGGQGSDTALQIESDQLLRLQGRRRHGREEINIIDVHGDDQRSEVEVTRNLTEEQDMSHSRKKKDMPTRQQRNKHQITYLAYKAKEREFDLKNQWAQNKMTRRQTQAKYGF